MRWLVLAIVACHASPLPPVAAWTAPPVGAYRASDPFHVAIAETEATWSNPPSFWPCPIEGATFLCGTKRVLAIRGDRVEPDAALERGRTAGLVDAIVGRWPDDAWLVVRIDLDSCGYCHYVTHRWRGDHWEVVPGVSDLMPGRWITAWRGALFAVRDDVPHRDLAAIGDAPLAKRIVADSRCAVLPSIAADATQLVVVGAPCGGDGISVTRWTDAGPSIDHPLAESGLVDAVATTRGPAILGTTFSDVPILLRFDDGRWVSRDPPGKTVGSYVVAPDGTEWIVVGEDAPGHSGVFARAPGGAWERVDAWQAEALRYGKTDTVWGGRLWIAEGSVWIEATVEGACQNTKGCEYRTVLLRTGPPASPLLLVRDRGT